MNKLDRLYKKLDELAAEKAKTEVNIDAECKRLAATVTVTERKASKILTCNGKSIVVGTKRNSHWEYKVHWYVDGKKAELIDGNCRGALFNWKIWLALKAGK